MKNEARTAATLFDPARLRVARQLQRLKRAQLADLVGVSGTAISQYESGVAKPRPGTLAQLALKLKMPISFFASSGHPFPPADADRGFFRSLRSSSQIDRDAALAHAVVLSELVRVIEARVTLPDLALPDDLTLDADADAERAEEIADRIRSRWELGDEPVGNVVRTLERQGVIVARLQLAAKKNVDAFSWTAPSRPVVILGADKASRDRSRFDAAHELGHLIMHHADPEPGSQPLERQADRFSAAFLLPADSFRSEWPGRVDWRPLIEMKQRWHVSLAALLYRARDLEVLSPSGYESAMKQMSRRGWRRTEPGSLGGTEKPVLLHKALALLVENGHDLDEIADEAHLPRGLIEKLLGRAEEERPLVSV